MVKLVYKKTQHIYFSKNYFIIYVANTEVVNAFDELNKKLNFNNSRHRLEHCLLLLKPDLEK